MLAAARLSLVPLLATVAALLALAILGAAPAAAQDGDLRIGYDQPIDSINPLGQQNQISYQVTTLGYDLLLNYATKDGSPDLATSPARSFTHSDDGLVWTYRLRPGLVWSDGRPMTSADVAFTYRTVVQNQTNVLRGYLQDVKRIETPDPLTVRITLERPNARMDSMNVAILPEHVFGKLPLKKRDTAAIKLPTVTTGPFMIQSYDPTGTTVLVPNPRFRGPKPAVKRILLIRYLDRQGELRDILLGKLDMVYSADARWLRKVRSEPKIKAWISTRPGFYEIAFNSCPSGGAGTCSGPSKGAHVKVVQDPAIRQALAWGIDRPDLARTAYGGTSEPAYGLISPYYTRYFEDLSKDPQVGYRYDPDKARAVLAAGGWNCRSVPCTKNGTTAEFELIVRSNDPEGQSAVKRIQAWAHDIGIKIDIAVMTETALNNRILATGSKPGSYAPSYDAFYWQWVGDVNSPDLNLEVLRTGSSWQDSFYSNPEYDRLARGSLRTLDFAKRVDLMHQAERVAQRDLPYIPTVFSGAVVLTRTDTWHNWQPSPTAGSGSPVTTNWQQFVGLRPGPAPTAAGGAASSGGGGGGTNTGTVVLLVLIALGVGGGVGLTVGRRRTSSAGFPDDWTEE